MKARFEYSDRGDGRHFTRRALEEYRKGLCTELRRVGKTGIAESYERYSLERFAAQGGYVIVGGKETGS